MNILAFDASSVSCGACVMKDGKILSESYINTALTHSRTLLDNIKRVLNQAEMTVSDIDKIALTVGPGSFTGVKIGVSCAKGLAYPEDKTCVAVSSLEAAAQGVSLFDGLIVAVMDARRQSFYNACFRSEKGELKRITEDRQIAASELFEEISKEEKVLLVSDGADLFYEYCKNNGREDISVATASDKFIRASSVAELAYKSKGAEVSHFALVPVYLRAPQAERERLERLKNNIEK